MYKGKGGKEGGGGGGGGRGKVMVTVNEYQVSSYLD